MIIRAVSCSIGDLKAAAGMGSDNDVIKVPVGCCCLAPGKKLTVSQSMIYSKHDLIAICK